MLLSPGRGGMTDREQNSVRPTKPQGWTVPATILCKTEVAHEGLSMSRTRGHKQGI